LQGKAKTTRKFAAVKRMIKPSDPRLKENVEKAAKKVEVEKKKEEKKKV
jgi:U3 small nucleolar RNA-associated protein 24